MLGGPHNSLGLDTFILHCQWTVTLIYPTEPNLKGRNQGKCVCVHNAFAHTCMRSCAHIRVGVSLHTYLFSCIYSLTYITVAQWRCAQSISYKQARLCAQVTLLIVSSLLSLPCWPTCLFTCSSTCLDFHLLLLFVPLCLACCSQSSREQEKDEQSVWVYWRFKVAQSNSYQQRGLKIKSGKKLEE